MNSTAQPEASHTGGHGYLRLLLVAGLAAAVLGLAGVVVLFTAFAGPGGIRGFVEGWSDLSDSPVVAPLLAASLACSLIGLILGAAGWSGSRRRGERPTASRVTVLVSAIGPVAVLVVYVLFVLNFVTA